jgi:hypothetical protein
MVANIENDPLAREALEMRTGFPSPGKTATTESSETIISELGLPIPSKPPQQMVDQDVYEAWKQHMIDGFERNNRMFGEILNAFMRPYWITVHMYRAMFIVGLAGVVLGAVLGVWQGVEYAWIFCGLSAASFITFFVSRPLISLEQNIQFITWLGLIFNTYWTRLMYANDEKAIQTELEKILNSSIKDIVTLLDKQAELHGKRPNQLQNMYQTEVNNEHHE